MRDCYLTILTHVLLNLASRNL